MSITIPMWLLYVVGGIIANDTRRGESAHKEAGRRRV